MPSEEQINCCTLQYNVRECTLENYPFLRPLLLEELDEVAAERGFSVRVNQWEMLWPESQSVTLTGMYVARAAAD